LRAPDGSVRAYVVPSASSEAAAAFGLPGFDPVEQMMLYRFWSPR
jgi:hypothetical protein